MINQINTLRLILIPALTFHIGISRNFREVTLDHQRGSEIKNSLENESVIDTIHKCRSYITKMVLTNEIAGFFYHCYIQKESIYFFKVITQKRINRRLIFLVECS